MQRRFIIKWTYQTTTNYQKRSQGLFKVKWHSPCHKLITTFLYTCKHFDDHIIFKTFVRNKLIIINLQVFVIIFFKYLTQAWLIKNQSQGLKSIRCWRGSLAIMHMPTPMSEVD